MHTNADKLGKTYYRLEGKKYPFDVMGPDWSPQGFQGVTVYAKHDGYDLGIAPIPVYVRRTGRDGRRVYNTEEEAKLKKTSYDCICAHAEENVSDRRLLEARLIVHYKKLQLATCNWFIPDVERLLKEKSGLKATGTLMA